LQANTFILTGVTAVATVVEVELAEATALLAAVDSLSMHLTLNVGEHGGNPMFLLLPQLPLLLQPLCQLLPLSLLFV